MKHLSPISGIAVNEKYIATAGYDNRVILWDRYKFESIAIGNHDHLVNQCEFSSCGKFLVTSSSDYSARIWQVPSLKLVKILIGHSDDVEFSTFDKQTERIATASRDCSIIINNFYDNSTKVLVGHDADVLNIQFIDDSLISCSDDGTVRKWNLVDNKSIILTKSDFQTDTVAINGEIIFAGDDAGVLHAIQNNDVEHIKAHDSGIKRLYFCNSEKILISMAYDRQCILWKIIDNKLEKIHQFSLPNIIWARSCSVYGDCIYFATFGTSFAVYNYKNHMWELEHIEHTNGINAISIYNNSIYNIGDSGVLKIGLNAVYETKSLGNFIVKFEDKIITGGQNGQLINTTDNTIVLQYKSPLNCAAVFRKKLYIGTYTGELLILEALKKNPENVSLHKNAIKSLIVFENKVITVCANGEICKYDSLLNDTVIIQGHDNIINSCVQIDDKTFVTVGRDRKLKIWDLDTLLCKEEIRTLHTHSIKTVAISSDTHYIATGSYNGTVYFLNRNSREWFKKRLTHAGISCIAFDEANNQFIVGSYDGNIFYIPIRDLS